MSPRSTRWLADVAIVTAAVCLFLPSYIANQRYAHAHSAATRAMDEAQRTAGTNVEVYSEILAATAHSQQSPEVYYQKREAWLSSTIWLFSIPLVAGLLFHRWIASGLVVGVWWLAWSLHGLRI